MRKLFIPARKGSAAAQNQPIAPDLPAYKTDTGVEWGDWKPTPPPEGLTKQEMNALRAKHKTVTPNTRRALEVKALIQNGLKCAQIVTTLHSKYGERMVKSDHAALSPIVSAKK